MGGEPGAPCESAQGDVVVVIIGAVFVGLVAIAPAAVVCGNNEPPGAIAAGELDKGVVAVRPAGAVDRIAAPLLAEWLAALEPCDCANAGVAASKVMINRLALLRRLGIIDLTYRSSSLLPPRRNSLFSPRVPTLLKFALPLDERLAETSHAERANRPRQARTEANVCRRALQGCRAPSRALLGKPGEGEEPRIAPNVSAGPNSIARSRESDGKRNAEKIRAQNPEARRRYAGRHPERVAAHQEVKRAIRKGEIVVPNTCKVRGCERTDIHLHHERYDRPPEVLALCAEHHRRCHAEGALRLKDESPRRFFRAPRQERPEPCPRSLTLLSRQACSVRPRSPCCPRSRGLGARAEDPETI